MRLPWEASFQAAGRCLGTPFPAPFFTLLPAPEVGRVGPWPLSYTGSQQGGEGASGALKEQPWCQPSEPSVALIRPAGERHISMVEPLLFGVSHKRP